MLYFICSMDFNLYFFIWLHTIVTSRSYTHKIKFTIQNVVFCAYILICFFVCSISLTTYFVFLMNSSFGEMFIDKFYCHWLLTLHISSIFPVSIYLSNVNNKDTRTTSVTSFWCLFWITSNRFHTLFLCCLVQCWQVYAAWEIV